MLAVRTENSAVIFQPVMSDMTIDASAPLQSSRIETTQPNLTVTELQRFAKALEDFCLGAMMLILTSPMMVLIAFAIRSESPGPVFFKQKRHGYNNREILVFKFRTMYTDRLDYDCDRQTQRVDPRVTRVGRFLRKSSLDELPQLLNVLRGEMSLVGPRPHAVNMRVEGRMCHEIIPHYAHRHCVKPGITGWAQVNGYRGAVESSQHLIDRIHHDFAYIERCSVVFDLYILVRTISALASPKNAF
jgi:lipopolysaccharide/colanic/teichoic acid biosynthesis glycosyltransferase